MFVKCGNIRFLKHIKIDLPFHKLLNSSGGGGGGGGLRDWDGVNSAEITVKKRDEYATCVKRKTKQKKNKKKKNKQNFPKSPAGFVTMVSWRCFVHVKN